VSPSLEAAIESARAQEVPWNAERSARIEAAIASKRVRWAMSARWALGGLASAALYASVLHVSGITREEGASEPQIDEPAPPSAAASGVPPEEVSLGERPVGDGGFE
jgi:hypothetical protein